MHDTNILLGIAKVECTKVKLAGSWDAFKRFYVGVSRLTASPPGLPGHQ